MGILSQIGGGEYRDVTVEGGIQHRAIDDEGNHYVLAHDGESDLQLRFYNDGTTEVDYQGITGCCIEGNILCSLVAADHGHEKMEEQPNCGCLDNGAKDHKKVGKEMLEESGIEFIAEN